MSVVTVQLGQCGNQVGQELFDVLCNDSSNAKDKLYRDCSHERFFREGPSQGTEMFKLHVLTVAKLSYLVSCQMACRSLLMPLNLHVCCVEA